MRALVANVEEVFREAAARWTLVAYFALSSLFILLFAAAVNLDVVNGALAGAKIFGQNVQMGRQTVDLDKLVLGFESGFAGFLYVVGTFLAIFATAHLVPRLQEKGTVDLYLSRPVGRVPLLLSRYLGGLLLAASNVVYLLGAMWLIVIWKTRLVHPRFFLAGGDHPVRNRGADGVRVPRRDAHLLDRRLDHGDVRALLPLGHPREPRPGSRPRSPRSGRRSSSTASTGSSRRPRELGAAVVALVMGDEGPARVQKALTLQPFVTTGLFGAACLALACLRFRRKDF